ncbi:MAG TPA: lipocalin family protein [Ohtaekwangia sp.]|uniref:lipocalin family protein n=1 Tax=Ohtaekwangia sp. TaxID=2066019 RepID=UPI002F935C9C
MKTTCNTWILGICFILFAGSTFAQQASKSGQKIIDLVVGTWQISQVYDGKKQITSNSDTLVQTIEFTREAKYITRNNSQKIDSGLFRINENHKILYLESKNSADGEARPVEWGLSLQNHILTLSGRGSPHAERFKYIYTRKSGTKKMGTE